MRYSNLFIMNNPFFNNPIVHGIIQVVLFVLPIVIAQGGSWQALTIGGVLTAVYQALKNKSSGLTLGGSHMYN